LRKNLGADDDQEYKLSDEDLRVSKTEEGQKIDDTLSNKGSMRFFFGSKAAENSKNHIKDVFDASNEVLTTMHFSTLCLTTP
jgi:hypothetical protein